MSSSFSQGYTASSDLLAYQRQLALAQGGPSALLPLPSQNMGLTGIGMGSRTGYDSNLQMGLGQHQML